MSTYTVHLTQTVSTAIKVDADDPDQAIDLAYKSDDMPGSMSYQAFGDASVDEAGEWNVIEVENENGTIVWPTEEAAP